MQQLLSIKEINEATEIAIGNGPRGKHKEYIINIFFLQNLGLDEVKSALTGAAVKPLVRNTTSSSGVSRSLRRRDNKNYKY